MRPETLRNGVIALIVLLGLNFLGMIALTVSTAVAQKPREYKVIEVLADTKRMTAAMNEQAQAGWEFVAIGMGDMNPPRLIFVR